MYGRMGSTRRKEARTVRDDRRDIMPDCVLEVQSYHHNYAKESPTIALTGSAQEVSKS